MRGMSASLVLTLAAFVAVVRPRLVGSTRRKPFRPCVDAGTSDVLGCCYLFGGDAAMLPASLGGVMGENPIPIFPDE